MRRISSDRIIAGAALGALPLLLAGCSFSFGGPGAVPADDVAEQSSEMLGEQVGQAPDDFTCADDLPAEVDAEIRCELVDGYETYGVTITTTSVDGDNVEWDILVDETPVGADTAVEEGDGTEEGGAAEETGAGDGTNGAADSGQVTNTEVINQTTPVLEAEGHSPENFVCSETHLVAEVGAELDCQFSENGTTRDITVTVTSVEGTNVLWDIQLHEAPL